MSLQIWMPLTKDLSNIGVCDATITNNGATYNTSGKLGGSYYFNGSSDIRISMPPTMTSIRNTSVCAWIKSTGSVVALGGISNDGNYTKAMVTLYTSGWQFGGASTYKYISGGSIANSGVWHHVACVVTDTNVTTYLDGTQVATKTFSEIGVESFDITSANFVEIGCDHPGSNEYLTGYVNDFRVYDHAISVAEIKALSMGLVCHYKLDDFQSTDNLIVNGFGELGTENWTSTSALSTTEIPPNHPEIKASFYGGNTTRAYIPVCSNNPYTISGYVKAISGQTGTKYPSILPYDKDKLFIQNFHSRDGFDTSTLTTLIQPLHAGDTVIHAADLSKWRVDTTSYYYYCAIFGYKNSFGDVYGDLVYTRDCPTFGTRTDKSNIDKTNNTITLLAAYTGADRPVGTSICQAAAGSTYFYPWGGIAVTSVTDWTFKTATITPAKTNRLWAAAYFTWNTYGGLYIAGNKLVDNFAYDTTVVDSSGYGNHGTRNGNMSTSYNTARHDISAVFDGTSAFIESEPLPAETKTISIWLKTSWVSSSGYRLAVHDKNTGLAIGWSSNQLITYVGSSNGGSGSRIVITDTNYTANQWNHIVVVKTGATTRNVYVNGVLATPASVNYWAGDLTKLNIGARHNGGAYSAYFNGQLSDFRAYATELSAEDVLALYNVGASVANDGTMFAYQMKEG